MNTKTEELLSRTFDFGVNNLKFLHKLPKEQIFSIITHQLAKASTSVGANYEEAQGAESKSDFIHKIGISLKEIRESNYWLRVLKELVQENNLQEELALLLNESCELKQIFISIKLSAGQNK
jgi:four helix bundle protein